jgi:phage protein U
MFAVLGEIVFETLTAPDSFQAAQRWDYAEQPVVEDAPRLQWIADGLETVTIEMLFHASFTNPKAQLDALTAAASDHQARALVFGNGVHRGYFVITSMRTTDQQMSDAGDAIAMRVRVELREWPIGNGANALLLSTQSFAPIGIVAAAPGVPTARAPYAAPFGVSPAISAPAVAYLAPTLAAAGVSSILASPTATGATSAVAIAADIPVTAIVRAA